MRIQHNIMAMSAYRNYTNNVSAMKKNLEKLSSGYKINRAGDDAAGLAISEKMRAQITGLETAQKNAKDGISLVQTAEGALTEVHDMLNRMVELATQSANGTYDNTTDRKQMQKEVDQLLSEINRIADSSNFNGIKLLDGSLGLNAEAVSNIEYIDAEAAVAPATIAGAVTVGTVHGQNAPDFKKPSVSIDLGDVKVKNSASTKATITVKISIGGQELSVEFASVSAGATITASAIASAVTTKYKASATKASATAGGWLDIGGAAYKVTGNAGKLTLELAGVYSSAASRVEAVTSATNTEAFTSSMADAFATAINPGAAVSVTASGSGAVLKNENAYIHGVTEYNPASAKEDADRWGADITITASKAMVNGNTLTIAGKTFTIAISSTASKSSITNAAATSGESVITIATKKAGTTASAQLKEFMDLIEGANAGNFKISGKNNTNMIHFDVRSTVVASKVASYTATKVQGMVSMKSAAVGAKNKGVEFDVTASKFTKGDVIEVGGHKFTFASTAVASKGTFKDAATLKAALENKFTAARVETSGTGATVKFTVRASSASAATPMVLGRGLTLQIGDTSDKFNQLNVGVQDMHAISLGIDNLKIDSEVDAQAAIAKIKSAINTVSDVRGTLGATQNRLDHTINNLSVMTENIQDAESTIRDVDVAEEMMAYTKNNILIQSAQAMLAQANQVPQGVLQLLQ